MYWNVLKNILFTQNVFSLGKDQNMVGKLYSRVQNVNRSNYFLLFMNLRTTLILDIFYLIHIDDTS